jgi:hypothetical protein
MGVFWFGQITRENNYVDLRIGNFGNHLVIHFNIADRQLWYNPQPSSTAITQSDAVSLYLKPGGVASALRFDAQLNSCDEDQSTYRKVYQAGPHGWVPTTGVPFSTSCYWRSKNGANDGSDDEGWWLQFDIPLSSLGRSGPPPHSETWQIAARMYDLDSAGSVIRASTMWPQAADDFRPGTWNALAFGIPEYHPPALTNLQSALIRQGENGAVVPDASVGGYFVCGTGFNKWTEWGNLNESVYSGIYDHNRAYANVQNQADISDRPCFSRYYDTFPLGSIPAGKVIKSAELRMYHYGNSDPTNAIWSYLQVLRVDPAWNENEIVWNNAPQAKENYSGVSVRPLTVGESETGVPVEITWDVTQSVVDQYSAGGNNLSLAVYSADRSMHSGKSFYTSNMDAPGYRPAIFITRGDPVQ